MLSSLLVLAASCGGSTAPIPDPSTSSGASGSAGTSGGASGGASSGGRACTDVGCANGFDVEFSYNTQGTYVVTLKIDDAEVVCKASIPIGGNTQPCNRSDVLLTLSGSALPVSQQSIGGIHLTSTSAKRLSIQVQRGDTMLATGKWDPIPYVTTPGPNGPGCEPATCTSGRVKLLER